MSSRISYKPVRVLRTVLGGDAEHCFLCLDKRFIKALASLTERLEWSATWVDDAGNRVELSDQEWSIIETGIGNLMDCEDLTDIREGIASILALLESESMTTIINNVGGCGCGCSGGSGTNLPEPTDDTPQTAPTPTSEELPNTDTYLFYVCRLANYLVDSLREAAEKFKLAWSVGTVTADTLVGILSQIEALRPVWVIVVQVAAYMSGIFNSGLFDGVIAIFTAGREEMVCRLSSADSPALAKDSIESYVMGTQYPYVTRFIAWLIIQFIPFESSFEEGAVTIPAIYNTAECCPPGIPEVPPGTCWLPEGYVSAKVNLVAGVNQPSPYSQSEDIDNAVAVDCGEASEIVSTFQFSDSNQSWVLDYGMSNNTDDAVGFYMDILENNCPDGNDPSNVTLARLEVDRDHNGSHETSVTKNTPYRVLIIRSEHLDNFVGLADEIFAVSDSQHWTTQGKFYAYRRAGVGFTPNGQLNGVHVRLGYIVPGG